MSKDSKRKIRHRQIVKAAAQEKIDLLVAELEKHKKFFSEIAKLTMDHDAINDVACVKASKLGEALERVNPDWWKEAK